VNITESYLLYKGCDLDFDEVTIDVILLKYNAFYRELDKTAQSLFIKKLQRFMQGKQFWMQGEDCYKEMPVLLSATATQLGFGYLNFDLKSYPNIVIRPQAYLAFEPLRILTGNVQGNTITVSWEHFLKDNLDPDDGNNVGLHEMAHAFAMELLYSPQKDGTAHAYLLRTFYVQLEDFTALEKQKPSSLFDNYSLQNADECWAKCIELFFEKPQGLEFYYPGLYDGVRKVLNQ
jgi:Mlc titration factor MtfA (ptsG expression regulator)